jgi:hypothetical protein
LLLPIFFLDSTVDNCDKEGVDNRTLSGVGRRTMIATIESTDEIVEIDGVETRLWKGFTNTGHKVHCFIHRIAPQSHEQLEQFETELLEKEKPIMVKGNAAVINEIYEMEKGNAAVINEIYESVMAIRNQK